MSTFESLNVPLEPYVDPMPIINTTDTEFTAGHPIEQGSAKIRKFYAFGPDITGGGSGHGLVFANEKKLLTPPRIIVKPAEGGFPVLHERPHIIYDPKKGKPPRDLEASLSGYWFISERLKTIFEAVDPDGFAFAKCDYTLANGTKGPTHYLCDVVRTLDAIDEDKSQMKLPTIYPAGEKVYDFTGKTSLVFREDVIGSAHIFRLFYLKTAVFCVSSLYDACKAIPDLKGTRFREATRL